MGWYLLIDRKWDRVVLKQVIDGQDEEDATVMHDQIIGSDTEVILSTDESHTMPANDGKLRIVV